MGLVTVRPTSELIPHPDFPDDAYLRRWVGRSSMNLIPLDMFVRSWSLTHDGGDEVDVIRFDNGAAEGTYIPEGVEVSIEPVGRMKRRLRGMNSCTWHGDMLGFPGVRIVLDVAFLRVIATRAREWERESQGRTIAVPDVGWPFQPTLAEYLAGD